MSHKSVGESDKPWLPVALKLSSSSLYIGTYIERNRPAIQKAAIIRLKTSGFPLQQQELESVVCIKPIYDPRVWIIEKNEKNQSVNPTLKYMGFPSHVPTGMAL